MHVSEYKRIRVVKMSVFPAGGINRLPQEISPSFDYRAFGRVRYFGIQEKQILDITVLAIILNLKVHFAGPGTGGAHKHDKPIFGKPGQGSIAPLVEEVIDEHVSGAIKVTRIVLEFCPHIDERYVYRVIGYNLFKELFIDRTLLFTRFDGIDFGHRLSFRFYLYRGSFSVGASKGK